MTQWLQLWSTKMEYSWNMLFEKTVIQFNNFYYNTRMHTHTHTHTHNLLPQPSSQQVPSPEQGPSPWRWCRGIKDDVSALLANKSQMTGCKVQACCPLSHSTLACKLIWSIFNETGLFKCCFDDINTPGLRTKWSSTGWLYFFLLLSV